MAGGNKIAEMYAEIRGDMAPLQSTMLRAKSEMMSFGQGFAASMIPIAGGAAVGMALGKSVIDGFNDVVAERGWVARMSHLMGKEAAQAAREFATSAQFEMPFNEDQIANAIAMLHKFGIEGRVSFYDIADAATVTGVPVEELAASIGRLSQGNMREAMSLGKTMGIDWAKSGIEVNKETGQIEDKYMNIDKILEVIVGRMREWRGAAADVAATNPLGRLWKAFEEKSEANVEALTKDSWNVGGWAIPKHPLTWMFQGEMPPDEPTKGFDPQVEKDKKLREAAEQDLQEWGPEVWTSNRLNWQKRAQEMGAEANAKEAAAKRKRDQEDEWGAADRASMKDMDKETEWLDKKDKQEFDAMKARSKVDEDRAKAEQAAYDKSIQEGSERVRTENEVFALRKDAEDIKQKMFEEEGAQYDAAAMAEYGAPAAGLQYAMAGGDETWNRIQQSILGGDQTEKHAANTDANTAKLVELQLSFQAKQDEINAKMLALLGPAIS